jgi:hypothetical protein
VSACPAAKRLAAMALPMRPSPMKPTCIALASFRTVTV